jgi:hypothetical protein
MKNINKLLCLLMMSVFAATMLHAQDSKAYDYQTDKKGNLKKDANGNTIDFSGVTSLLSSNTVNQNTQIYDLPFDVVFLGKVYKSFLVGTSGYLVLGNTDISSQPFQFPTGNANTIKQGNSNYRFQGVIAPFWDFQNAKSIKYTVTGTAPNRTFVVEWVTYIPNGASTTTGNESNYQARIYENDGTIEYVYGKMVVPAGNTTNVSATIGMGRNSALSDYSFLTVADLDSFSVVRTLAEYNAGVDNLYNTADAGNISPLNYDNDSNARRFVFTPDPISAPTNLQAVNVTFDDAILYWDDNDNNEVLFEVYKADRFGNFFLLDTTTQNISFYFVDGFYPGETYSFRVRAINQGRYSAYSNTFTFSIPQAQPMVAIKSGNWMDTATWSTNAVPTRYDSVYISNGYQITMNGVDADVFHLAIDSGSLIYENTSQTRKLSAYGSVWVGKNGRLAAVDVATYTNTNMGLAVRGNVYNSGILDFYSKGAGTKEAGIKLSFFGSNTSWFTSDSGSVTNLNTLGIERDNITDSVYFRPYALTIRDYNTDVLSGAGLVTAANWAGTLVVDGNFTLENRFFVDVNPIVGDNAGLWLANDSLLIPSNYNNLTFNGALKISKGKVNIGNAANNILNGSFDFTLEGGELNLGGRMYSTNATAYTQTGGVLRVATIGNSTTEPSFGVPTTTTVNMLGGEIIIVQPGTATNHVDYNIGANDQSVFGNTWVKLTETAGASAGNDFVIGGNLPNFLADTAANATDTLNIRLIAATHVYGDFILSTNDNLNLNPAYLYLHDSIVNNGNIYSTTTAGAVVISGDTQTLAGSGSIKTPRLEVFQTNPASTFTIPADSILHTINLNLTQGNVVNAKYILVGDSSSDISVEVGRTGSINAGALLDSFPNLTQGTGTYNLQYLGLNRAFATGFEVPASRVVNTLLTNTDSVITISGGAIEVLQTLTLTKGIVTTDSINKIRVTNPVVAAVLGGNDVSYIKGPLTRKIDKNLTTGSYNFPVGNDEFSRVTLTDLTTGSNVAEVTAEFKTNPFSYTLGSTISNIDEDFGYWQLKADSNANSLTSFTLNVNYKVADGFVRLAAGKVPSITTAPTLDSVGTQNLALSALLVGGNNSFDSANNIMFVAAGEYLGDTLYNNLYKVGAGKDFENLTAIARKLSSSYIAGNPTFLITSSYTDANETYPIYFTQMRYAGNGGKVLIRLDSNAFGVVTGSKTKSLNIAYGMIAMYGADGIEFDGAGYDILGNPSHTREWTFVTETNAANASVFMFQQDAQRNTLNNLNIISNASGAQGAVYIGGTSTGGLGNDNNTIKNSLLNTGDRVASYGVLSIGTSATTANDSIKLLNNEFSNFNTAHVLVSSNSGLGWKISGNHFYQNDSRVLASNVRAIDINDANTAYGFEISYNYFGGSQKYAAGSAWTYNGTGVFSFINITSAYKPSTLKGNVIKNFYQSSTSSFLVRPLSINKGYWIIAGNKFGGTSSADVLSLNSGNITSILYVENATDTKAEITDNDFSFINNPTLSTSSVRGLKLIDYNAPVAALIARNKMHDITVISRRFTSIQEGAFTGIFINNTASNNVIDGNEIYSVANNYTNIYNYNAGIGISEGGGVISNNKIYDFNYASTYASTPGHIVGIHVQGSRKWDIINNQIQLSNASYTNKVVSLQGIRYYTVTSDAGLVSNNTVLLGGVTTNNNSYAFVQGGPTAKVKAYNNIFVNNNVMNGGAAYRSVAVYVFLAGGNFESDFNLIHSQANAANTFNNASTGLFYDLKAWQTAIGNDKNSIDGLPVFRNDVNDLLLTLDTANWKLKAAGRETGVMVDYENDVRNQKQPDIGADEFIIPMYNAPVFVGGNNVLCAGNSRILLAQNPNTAGQIYWFNEPYGGDTLQVGDTLYTAVLNANTSFYAQVSDSLMRSYRIEVKVPVTSVTAPNIANLPIDSICKGTALTLMADSAAGLTIDWYDSLNATTPFYTGQFYNTGALTDSAVTYYLSTTNNGCTTPKIPFTVYVADTTITIPTINNQTVCAGNPVSWNVSGGDIIRWYNEGNSVTPFLTDTIFNTNKLNADTTFWYQAFNGRCASNLNPVSVTVNPIPTVPVIDSLFTICYNTGIALTPTVSGTANWYINDSITTSFTTGTVNFANLVNDTTLYTDNTQLGCTSPRVKTTVKVQSPATLSVASVNSPICFNTSSQIVLSKTGNSTVNWYDQYTGSSPIANGDTLNTTTLIADGTYYYEAFDGLCTGPRDSVTVYVTPFAAKPVINPVAAVCFGNVDTLVATAAGAVINWYETKTSAPIASGTDYITNAITGDKKYFAKAFYGSCESEFEEIKVAVRTLPQPPLVDSVPLACRGTSVTLNTITPNTTEWYNSLFATSPVFVGNTFATPALNVNTTYYVQSFDGTCRSQKRAVTVGLRNIPAVPVVKTTDPFCWNTNGTLEASSGALVRWYKNNTDTIPFLTDSTVYIGKMLKDTTYYIDSYDGYCTSAKVTYNVGVIRYLDGFSLTIPDSANINTQVVLSATGKIDNLYGWNFGSGASISSATGTGPHNIEWSTKGLKNVRFSITKKAGNVTCDTVFTKTVKVYNLSELLSAKGANASSIVNIYPNPASSVLNIAMQGENTLVNVALYDATGKQVYNQKSEGNSLVAVDVSGFAPGVYLLHATLNNNQAVMHKVIIDY